MAGRVAVEHTRPAAAVFGLIVARLDVQRSVAIIDERRGGGYRVA